MNFKKKLMHKIFWQQEIDFRWQFIQSLMIPNVGCEHMFMSCV